MKFLSGIKNSTRKNLVICLLVTAGIVSVATHNSAQAANISLASGDCNSNAVLYCGAGSVSALQNKYKNGVPSHNTAKSIHDIYNYFGISASDINSMSQYVVAGEVYIDSANNGSVEVNGKVVATNVWTAGRQAGGTKIISDGTTFYRRHPAVSFESNPLSAYVVMKNGVFQFAVLSSCGNPVAGTPKKQPTPTPTKKPTPKPTRKPTPTATPTPAMHYACIENACKEVLGAGFNTCSSNLTCHPLPTPTRKPTPICTPTPPMKPVSRW